VLAAQVRRRGEQFGISGGLPLPATIVGRGDAGGTAGAEAGIELADGAWTQAQIAGDLVGGVALLGACPDELALGHRKSPWHGKPPCRNRGRNSRAVIILTSYPLW
jgi:hypothetical protein